MIKDYLEHQEAGTCRGKSEVRKRHLFSLGPHAHGCSPSPPGRSGISGGHGNSCRPSVLLITLIFDIDPRGLKMEADNEWSYEPFDKHGGFIETPWL